MRPLSAFRSNLCLLEGAASSIVKIPDDSAAFTFGTRSDVTLFRQDVQTLATNSSMTTGALSINGVDVATQLNSLAAQLASLQSKLAHSAPFILRR